MQRSLQLLIPLFTCFAFLTGCTGEDLPPNYETTVSIMYQGEPVENALVTMRPDSHEAPTAAGITDIDGEVEMFSFKGKGHGVIPGKYRVAVEKQNVEKVDIIEEDDPEYGKNEASNRETWKEREDVLPKKYVSASTSGLTCTVTEDPSDNNFAFELQD